MQNISPINIWRKNDCGQAFQAMTGATIKSPVHHSMFDIFQYSPLQNVKAAAISRAPIISRTLMIFPIMLFLLSQSLTNVL